MKNFKTMNTYAQLQNLLVSQDSLDIKKYGFKHVGKELGHQKYINKKMDLSDLHQKLDSHMEKHGYKATKSVLPYWEHENGDAISGHILHPKNGGVFLYKGPHR